MIGEANANFEEGLKGVIRIEGGLFSWEFLENILRLQGSHQQPAEYDLTSSFTIDEELERHWRLAGDIWRKSSAQIKSKSTDLDSEALDSYAPFSRIAQLLYKVLGYVPIEKIIHSKITGHTGSVARPSEQEWHPPYTSLYHDALPILWAPREASLDSSCSQWKRHHFGGSPYSALQQILGRQSSFLQTDQQNTCDREEREKKQKNDSSSHPWGMVTNGSELRIVRLSDSLIQKSYIAFDLDRIFAEENVEAFFLLWLLLHTSRLRPLKKHGGSCFLEIWLKEQQASGERVLEKLHQGVTRALEELGSGFLRNPHNSKLLQKLSKGELTEDAFFVELLHLVYNFLFLIAMEERSLLHPEEASNEASLIYAKGYSLSRLRKRAARQQGEESHQDLWIALQITLEALSCTGAKPIGITPLGGLFNKLLYPHLESCVMDNAALLRALKALFFFEKQGRLKRINYKELGAEEFGSIYEVLLDLTPMIESSPWRLHLERAHGKGSERKLSGSYYTPTALVEQLLKTALDPVIERAIADRGEKTARQALLELTIIDSACGSGHFLLAAARRLAAAVADHSLQEGASYAELYHSSLREVVSRCIYGVDRNPLAVELCKIALWLETLEPGKPLAFLDAQIQCGDALIGVLDPKLLEEGIPDDAFNALEGDEKVICSTLKKKNRGQRGGQLQGDLFMEGWGLKSPSMEGLQETLDEVHAKEISWRKWLSSTDYLKAKYLADLWTAAYFIPKNKDTVETVPLSEDLTRQRRGLPARPGVHDAVSNAAKECSFFHWHLAFPKVMESGGFDVVLGNPPWERVELQETEFFARYPEIINASTTAKRKKEIAKLGTSLNHADRALFNNYKLAKRQAEASSLFVRTSNRFPLSGVGKINLYPLFSELAKELISLNGRAGIIVPTGISTDAFTQYFFSHLVDKQLLHSLYDFENSQKRWFADVDSRYRFSLLTIAPKSAKAELAFMVQEPRKIADIAFSLTSEDFKLFNPNTRTCPLFRTWYDAELAKKIYRRAPVLVDEGKGPAGNPWEISFLNMFNMSSDSHLFRSREELERLGANLDGNIFRSHDGQEWLPLLEAKMIHLYDHRWASYDAQGSACSDVAADDKANLNYVAMPRYWIEKEEVEKQLAKKDWNHKWFMGWREVTNASNERSLIYDMFPARAVGHKINLFFSNQATDAVLCLHSCLSNLIVDYLAKQKVGATSFSIFIFKQLPILPPLAFGQEEIAYIKPRASELIYTSHEMRPFAEDCDYHGPPFTWDEERRAVLKAELDAYYARLYGLTRDELSYILDPTILYGEQFPSETFRVLKNKELKEFGEYRTARLVLEAWDRQENEGAIPDTQNNTRAMEG